MYNSLDQFDITEMSIGSGTYGQVKQAKLKTNKKLYALKIIKKEKLKTYEKMAIDREIEVHSQIQHPNIIKFYGYFEDYQNIVIVLEFGVNSLSQKLIQYKKFVELETYQYFNQLVNAVDYLHQNDVLHRDLKPENIVIDQKQNLKIIDFGWCTTGIKLKRNTFCGTYEYMSPEVVNKLNYNQNIDIWSLGILLYEFTHGFTPFDANSPEEIMNNIKYKEIGFEQFLLVFDKNINLDLKNLISNILCKNQEKRFQIKQIKSSKWMIEMQNKYKNYEKKIDISNKENNSQIENSQECNIFMDQFENLKQIFN